MISRFLAIGSILLLGGTASAQQIQGDFDKDWVADTKGNGALLGNSNTYLRPGTQPVGWEASNVHQKVLMEVKETLVTPDVDRKENPNGHSVLLTNKKVGAMGITSPAPAYITLGVPWVYAQATLSKCDGGTLGGINFSKRPDAIRGWYKRTGNSGKSQVIVYAWKGTYYSTVSTNPDGGLFTDKKKQIEDQDRCIINDEGYDSKTEGAKLIAKCDESIIGEATEWTPFEFPIQYVDNEIPEKINVVISACDYWNRSNIQAGETMTVDDVEFVYWSDLRSLSYNGTPVDISDPNNIKIEAKYFDVSKVSCTSGQGADIQKSYDPATGILTITINGEDVSVNSENHNTYRVKVVPPTPEEVTGTYNRWITVNMPTPISESANDIEITSEEDGEASFGLNEFYLGAGSPNMGPIVVPNAKLSYTGDGSISIVAENQMVAIPGLGGAEMPITLTATVSADKKLVAALNISLAGVTVNVGEVPFVTSEENGILKVTGSVATASGAAYVKGTSTANEIDLTGATLAKGLKTSDFSAEANNLFKIADGQSLGGNNVIKNGVCDNFVLTDGQSFNAPENFTASQITYERDVKASANGTDEVYTFVLPFTFTADKVNGTVYDLNGVYDGVLDFNSIEGSTELKANRPYLVVSKGTELLNNEGLSGEVLATGDLTNEVNGGVTMVGAYEATPITSDASWYGYNAKGEFVKATSGTINPFRAAIKSTGIAPSSYALKLDGTVTGILNLENPNAKVDVYTISGVCVRKNVPAASALNGLSRGVYIVGGQKVVK